MINFKALGDHMKIRSLNIKNVGNIAELNLSFNDHMNVISGANGVGKTTILKAITAFFTENNTDLKKKYGTNPSYISAKTWDNEKAYLDIEAIAPWEVNGSFMTNSFMHDEAQKLLNFSDSRSINYKKLDYIQKYPDRRSMKTNTLATKVSASNTMKNWLVNRLVAESGDTGLSDAQKFNILKMKETFSVIDNNIKFKRLDYATFEILLEDYGSDLYFEFESTGFKNILFIVMGIIQEIEYRFDNLRITDFDGIILIDEVELHLHPTWQNKILSVLKEMFPMAQFIITTHSPSVLQNLSKDELIPLYIEDGDVKERDLELSDYGLKGWTLEEILTDVMGVESLKSEELQDAMSSFTNGLDSENYDEAKAAYEKLNTMLHAENPLRQILDIQKAGLF